MNHRPVQAHDMVVPITLQDFQVAMKQAVNEAVRTERRLSHLEAEVKRIDPMFRKAKALGIRLKTLAAVLGLLAAYTLNDAGDQAADVIFTLAKLLIL